MKDYTLTELDMLQDPAGWGAWYQERDKTRHSPPLPGFERCRSCHGGGFCPAGPLAPMTGMDCSTCRGKGICIAGTEYRAKTVKEWNL